MITDLDIALIPNITKGTRKAWVRIYDALSQWSWYICEYDGENLCYGLITDSENKTIWTYFTLSELMLIRNQEDLPLKRDLCWIPKEVEKTV